MIILILPCHRSFPFRRQTASRTSFHYVAPKAQMLHITDDKMQWALGVQLEIKVLMSQITLPFRPTWEAYTLMHVPVAVALLSVQWQPKKINLRSFQGWLEGYMLPPPETPSSEMTTFQHKFVPTWYLPTKMTPRYSSVYPGCLCLERWFLG